MRRLLRLLLCASVALTVLTNNFLLDVPLLLRRISLHYFSPKVTVLRLPVISAWYSDRTRTAKQISAVNDEPVRRAACITANVLQTKVDAHCDKLAIELSDVILTSESRQ